ncbi:glycosyltransferase family 4 protein [Leptolyngbya sp. AN03gr2]|uniref:glycosyltransferase family 4 protein n=1 Tax=unclassified Leptolyngbya TaxID=2650499 RepID=UPI003D31554E
MNPSPWICCQLGAREHYAIPRALHQSGQLARLITDAWVTPRSRIQSIPIPQLRSLRDRYHPDLSDAAIDSMTTSLIQFELRQKLKKTTSWDDMIARNHWFQHQILQQLRKHPPQGARPIFFAYSYAALDLLKYAKSKGWYTVLGQIDPGIVEEQIVKAEQQRYPALSPSWSPVPPSYWDNWREECAIADCILVNSEWSRQALIQAGINADKIRVVPLVYRPTLEAQSFQRTYPTRFSSERPLRVLFLGRVILRKGIAAILEAAEQLRDRPVEFLIVGASEIKPPATEQLNIRWINGVPRSLTDRYYQQADVFLFPTLSDGFGLTQLEAQAWKLPLIVSKFCGEVVSDGISGKVLPEVSGTAIATVLESFLDRPSQLATLSQATRSNPEQTFTQLSHQLKSLNPTLLGTHS